MDLSRTEKRIRTFTLSFLLLAAGMSACLPAPAFAADDETPPVEATVETFPGLQDVVPMASQLADDLARTTAETSAGVDIGDLSKKTEQLELDWIAFRDQVRSYGELVDWPANRLLQAQTQIEQHNRDFSNMLDQVSEPLSSFEQARVAWSERRQYWIDWAQSLQKTGASLPRDPFKQVDELITTMLSETDSTTTSLVKLQQRISKGREAILAMREQLDTELTDLRRDPLTRNGHPLLSGEFFQQFDGSLRKKVREGLRSTFQFQADFFDRQGWLLGLQTGLVLLLFWIFRRLELATADRAEEWRFILRRPIAAALFIAATIPQLFYQAPPPLLLLCMTSLAVFSAARLAAALITDTSERSYIYVLAVIYIFSGALNVIGTPLPYHRLYLVALCSIGLPALLLSIHRQMRRKRRADKVVVAMTLGLLVLLTVLIAELTGYVTLASRLLDATFGTVVLLLLALMMLRIGAGGIEFIFSVEKIRGRQFVKQLGKRAAHRFKNLLRIVVVVAAVHYMFEVWGLGKGFDEVWQAILGLEFSIGEFRLSLQMVALVLLVLYLSILTSWFLQAFIESQLFYNKRIDRGVRDAVKKLCHYCLILIGFLMAMSMAGIDLQNFTILAGAFGIGIGFGLQEVVNNFVSGLILLFERPVKVGDTVIVGDNWGVINNIGMRSTVVETLDQSEIIVPNSQMISEKVTNWTLSSNVSRIVIPIGVKYGSDMHQVLSILEEVANDHPDVSDTPPPSAIFTAFGDSSLEFELRVWLTDVMIRFRVRSDLGIAIAERLHAAGIEIPFPQRDLHLRSIEPGLIESSKTDTKKPASSKKEKPRK